jgi:hypothetical protein
MRIYPDKFRSETLSDGTHQKECGLQIDRTSRMILFPLTAPLKSPALARIALSLILVCLFAGPSHAYSVLTHEAIIDSAWDTLIKPQLIRRYAGRLEESACLCLRRLNHPGYGLLPIRK